MSIRRSKFTRLPLAGGFATVKTAARGNLSTEAFADAMAKGMDRSAKKDGARLPCRRAAGCTNLDCGNGSRSAGDVSEMGKILASLQGGKGEERHRQGLARLGLGFGDVDLLGEDQATAMQRIGHGLQRVKPEERMGVMKNIVGDSELARKMLSALESMAANDKNFKAAVALQTSGLAAGKQRTASMLHHRAAEAGGDFELQLDAADLIAGKKGAYEFMSGTRRGVASALRLIQSDEKAIESTFAGAGGMSGLQGDFAEFNSSVKQLVSILKGGADKQDEANKFLERIADKAKGKPARQAAE